MDSRYVRNALDAISRGYSQVILAYRVEGGVSISTGESDNDVDSIDFTHAYAVSPVLGRNAAAVTRDASSTW